MRIEVRPMKKDAEASKGISPFALNKESFNVDVEKIECPMNRVLFEIQWRHYFIFETVVSIMLFLIMLSVFQLSSKMDRSNELLLKVQIQMNKLEERLSSDNISGLTEFEVLEPVTEMIATTPVVTTTTTEPPKIEPIVLPTPICNSNYTSPIDAMEHFNAANYFFGARVVSSLSSSSDNNPFFGRDQSSYVLLDRKEPPPNKAWCSDVKQPNLTVKLTKNIEPFAVSYQHTKWNGTVPNGAPKVYDLVGCQDSSCEQWELLVSNCTYVADVNETQEQICSVPLNETRQYGFQMVQFRFHENHGHVEKTCAYVVRVYGGASKLSATKVEMEKNEETCTDLIWHYHNSPFVYNNLRFKNCDILYGSSCCMDCPECCEDCELHDSIFYTTLTCVWSIIKVIFRALGTFLLYFLVFVIVVTLINGFIVLCIDCLLPLFEQVKTEISRYTIYMFPKKPETPSS